MGITAKDLHKMAKSVIPDWNEVKSLLERELTDAAKDGHLRRSIIVPIMHSKRAESWLAAAGFEIRRSSDSEISPSRSKYNIPNCVISVSWENPKELETATVH